MEFDRTFDYDVIRKIMVSPYVYPHITDDGCPSVECFEPNDSPHIWYITVHDKGELLGMWIFIPQNAVCYEVHTCLLPAGRGRKGFHAAREMAKWIFTNSPCRRIVTNIPQYNHAARMFAVIAGMKPFGVNPRSFLKNGELHDQILLGMSKE